MVHTVIMHQRGIKPVLVEIEKDRYKFVITDCPSESNIQSYVKQLKRHRATALVRVCETNYSAEALAENGIEVFDLVYENGTYPSKEIIEQWFKILKKKFEDTRDACVAVHCVEGLGRAPVLVALALIELGLTCEEAVILIREKQRGAINTKQLNSLMEYRPQSKLLEVSPVNNQQCLHYVTTYVISMFQGIISFCGI